MTTMLKFIITVLLCSVHLMVLSGQSIDHTPNSRIFDSIDNDISVALKKGDKVEAIKLMNGKGKLLFNQGLYASELMLLNNAIKLSDNGCDTVKYPEIKTLYMESLNSMGGAYCYIAKYEEAINSYILMYKYNRGRDVLYNVKFYNGMGVAFSMSGKYDQAKGYYIQALEAVKGFKDEKQYRSNSFAINANLGGVFLFQREYDSAHIYIMEAQKLAILLNDKSMLLNCLQLLGTLNGSIGKAELAISYYNEACDVALECGNYFTIPSIKLNISEIYASEKNYDAAFSTAFEALEMSRKFDMVKLEMNALRSISRLYKQTGDNDKSLSYLEDSDRIRDSLFSQDNEERFLRQKTDFDMYKLSVEKEISDKNMEIKEGKRVINNLIVSIVILLLALTLIYLTHRLVKQEREKKVLENKHNTDINTYIDKQKAFENEIEKKNKELFLSSLSVAKNSELTGLLMQKLKILKTNTSSKGQETIKEAEELVLELTKASHIVELNECLKNVPSEFYDKLEIRYPDLTTSEKKICALMSFGLQSKDIANMTGKSNGAIGNIKFRIRQKINVDTGVDLEDFMFHIRES